MTIAAKEKASETRRLPDFIGIGAQKCATTWLSEVLRRHPDVFLPPEKELDFFASDVLHDRGEDWYANWFSRAGSSKVCGEYSVAYMDYAEKVAPRVAELVPDVKLIAILRNPVRRAYSHYRFWRQLGKIDDCSFLQALDRYPQIVAGSMYANNLRPFVRLFPRENLLVLRYEEIQENGFEVQSRVFEWLGVDPEFDSGLAGVRISPTFTPRSRGLEKLRLILHRAAKNNGLPHLISWAKRFGMASWYRKMNDRGTPELSDEEYCAVAERFVGDIQSLSDLVNMPFDDWHVRSDIRCVDK